MAHVQTPAERQKTVSSASVLDLVRTCERLKVMTAQALESLDIDPSALRDPTQRVPENLLIDLWQHIDQNTKIPHVGLLIGAYINPAAKGVLASWVSQCGTAREAFKIFRDNISLMNPSEHWRFSESNSICTLQFSHEATRPYPDIATERSMSALITWGRALTGTDYALTNASFCCKEPSYLAQFHRIFGANVTFNAPTNTLTFDSAFLDLPVTSANPLLKTMIESKASRLIHTLTAQQTIAEQVKKLIETSLALHTHGIELVCESLAMSRQTLYRKLKQENTDYKTLVDEVRKKQADELLRQDAQTILSISLTLGYKETSSFYKAFKRWHGTTVKNYLNDTPSNS